MSLLFNMLSRFVIAILPRSKHLLILWLQWESTVILEPKKIKSATISTFSLCICHEVMELDAMILVFWMLSFKPASFYSPLSPSSRGSLVSPRFLPFSSVQSPSCVQLFVTPWTTVHQASLSITNSQSWLRLMSIELVMPSNHLILCCPLLLLPSIFSSIRIFSNESALCIRWPKYWHFGFNIGLTNDPGLIYFRMDWLDLLAVQGTLKSLH